MKIRRKNSKCWLCGDRDETINHNKRMQQTSTGGV